MRIWYLSFSLIASPTGRVIKNRLAGNGIYSHVRAALTWDFLGRPLALYRVVDNTIIYGCESKYFASLSAGFHFVLLNLYMV